MADSEPKALTAGEIRQQCQALQDNGGLQRFRTAAVLSHYYGVSGLAGYAGDFDPAKPSSKYRALTSLTHQNAMRAVIDTMLSQTVRIPDLRVQVLGGRWGRQRSARKIGQWLSGSFRRADLGRKMWQVATDAATNPVAAARVWMEDDGLHLARVRPDQVIYNPREGKNPRNLWLRYGVPREELAARFPKHATFIKSKQAPKYVEDTLYTSLDLLGTVEADLVEVIEHWHLGSRGTPGTYAVVCGDQVLNDDTAYADDFFPVVELVDCPSWDSFGGHSLGEQLLPYQLSITRKRRLIDTAQGRLSFGRVYLPKGSEIEKQAFSRTPGEFIEFNALNGGSPTIQAGQAVSSEFYRTLQEEEAAMWELAGVSKSSGSGTIPAGMSGASGKALREYNDTAATRLKARSEALDSWFERLCTVALKLAVKHFKAGGKGAVVRAAGTKVLEEVDFKDLDLNEADGIEIRCVGVSGLPMHPGARLEYVTELVKNDFVRKEYAVKLLSIPDVEKAEDIATSALDLATDHIEEALYEGATCSPEPNPEYLDFLLDIGTRELMVALRFKPHAEETAETKAQREQGIEQLRRLLASAKDLQDKLGPKPQGPGPGNVKPEDLLDQGAAPTPAAAVPTTAERWAA